MDGIDVYNEKYAQFYSKTGSENRNLIPCIVTEKYFLFLKLSIMVKISRNNQYISKAVDIWGTLFYNVALKLSGKFKNEIIYRVFQNVYWLFFSRWINIVFEIYLCYLSASDYQSALLKRPNNAEIRVSGSNWVNR